MLRLENVSKYYHTSTSVSLGLKEINLTFEKGEFVVITGESGSGKSTLLNVISGMLPYEEGELYVEGKQTSAYDSEDWENYRREKIGFIYQNYNLIDSYTALENVESVMHIKGQDRKKIKEKALFYLEQVGLGDKKNNRASRLSSGQKQRLSIARALAKETDVIVADEPTGNLDTENGARMMELLYQLSANKLVIVVTHNYEQVKELKIRKIRLYDGEVAEDISPEKRQIMQEETKKQEITKEKAVSQEKAMSQEKASLQEKAGKEWAALAFLVMNKKAQPRRNLFLFLLLLCISFAFFVFLGGFFSNMDDAMGREYSDKAFANGDKTRLSVRKTDGSAMSEQDRAAIQEVKYVQEADLYDGINDVNYYYKENEDYRLEYHKKEGEQDLPDYMEMHFLDDSNYMHSASGINESDLVEGRKPADFHEILISSKDKGKVGDTIKVFLRNRKNWGDKQYVCLEMTITGITRGKKKQFYFYEDFCKTLYHSVKSTANVYNSRVDKGKKGFADASVKGDITDNTTQKQLENAISNRSTIGNVVQMTAIFICNDELEKNEIRASESFLDAATIIEQKEKYQIFWSAKVLPKVLIHYSAVSPKDGESSEEEETKKENTGKQDTEKQNTGKQDTEKQNTKKDAGKDKDTDQDIEKDVNIEKDRVLNYNTSKLTNHGSVVCEIGSELFYEIYGADMESYQMSVYIKDYAYTKQVIEKINALGYEAISVYQTGSTAHNYDVVYERLQSMCISLGAFIAVFLLGMFLIYAMLKLKRGDFLILKALGLRQKTVVYINCLDMYGSMCIAAGLVIVICNILNNANIKFMQQLVQYYQWYHYLILFTFCVLFSGWTAGLFNRHIEKHTKV